MGEEVNATKRFIVPGSIAAALPHVASPSQATETGFLAIPASQSKASMSAGFTSSPVQHSTAKIASCGGQL